MVSYTLAIRKHALENRLFEKIFRPPRTGLSVQCSKYGGIWSVACRSTSMGVKSVSKEFRQGSYNPRWKRNKRKIRRHSVVVFKSRRDGLRQKRRDYSARGGESRWSGGTRKSAKECELERGYTFSLMQDASTPTARVVVGCIYVHKIHIEFSRCEVTAAGALNRAQQHARVLL